jgi:curved DNA-binding protein CbpA
MSDEETYYEALGVEPDASRDELKSAYQERVAELEAARQGKNVSASQLQSNREEVARVRAAWNVLADPFQRSRYDESIGSRNGDGGNGGDDDHGDEGEVEVVGSERPEVRLTGWRKWMAPPPAKPRSTAPTGSGTGKPPPPTRPMREPTIPPPPGIRYAEPRARGMALLFDVAVVFIIYTAVFAVVPGLVNSDYSTKYNNSQHFADLHDAQNDIDDADKAINEAQQDLERAQANGNTGAERSAQDDLKSAQQDKRDAQKDFNDAAKDVDKQFDDKVVHNANSLEQTSKDLSSDISGALYVTYAVILVLALAYLVPMTAITGRTLGMRGRRIRVVKTDFTPVGWLGAFLRFFVPITLALVLVGPLGPVGPILGLGMVLWAFRDPNGQGLHDKLARTFVVADDR